MFMSMETNLVKEWQTINHILLEKNVHLFANNMFDHFNQFTYEISIVTVWLDTKYKQIKLKHQTYNC